MECFCFTPTDSESNENLIYVSMFVGSLPISFRGTGVRNLDRCPPYYTRYLQVFFFFSEGRYDSFSYARPMLLEPLSDALQLDRVDRIVIMDLFKMSATDH